MWFGPLALDEDDRAVGALLAHTHRLPGRVLRKGIALTAADIAQLRAAGHREVLAARLEPGDVGEDIAASRVARAAAGRGVRLSRPVAGRCNAHARERGLLVYDPERLRATNSVDWRVTVGALPPHTVVEPGEMVATAKIIPFAVGEDTLRQAEAAAAEPGALLRVAPFQARLRAGLVLSTLTGHVPGLLERAAQAQRSRLGFLGIALVHERCCPHDIASVAAALRDCLERGLDPVLFLGASSIIDAEDVFPAALRQIGGTVRHVGMPVDPGNLLVLGEWGAQAVLGLPGCARSLKPSGYDQVLQRLAAGLTVSSADIAAMGAGGLLVGSAAARQAPRPPPPPAEGTAAAIVLAAGRSRRMGAVNKLLEPVDGSGQPMCRVVVERLAAAGLSPVVVVTGHDAGAVRAAMAGAPVQFAHNPDHEEGMGTSLAAGARALGEVDAVLVVLGDMPDVSGEDIAQLLRAYHSASGATIVAPSVGGRRGNPVLFSGAHLPALRRCAGDQGARRLLREHADALLLVALRSDGTLLDIDTPDQLAARRARLPPTPPPEEETP